MIMMFDPVPFSFLIEGEPVLLEFDIKDNPQQESFNYNAHLWVRIDSINEERKTNCPSWE